MEKLRLRTISTHVGQVAGEFQAVHQLTSCHGITLDSETQNTSENARTKKLLGEFMGSMGFQAEVRNPRDLRVLFEIPKRDDLIAIGNKRGGAYWARAKAFWLWRSARRLRVSRPWRSKNAAERDVELTRIKRHELPTEWVQRRSNISQQLWICQSKCLSLQRMTHLSSDLDSVCNRTQVSQDESMVSFRGLGDCGELLRALPVKFA